VHIFCSGLPNDQDMIKALGSCAIPCPLFTDCGFWGVNDTGETVLVGIERKKIGDIVACILDGRLMHQAQIAKENGIDVLCVIIEGRIRSNPDDGLLEVPVWGINPRTMHRAEMWQPVKPTLTYSRFDQFLTELDYLAGVIVKRSDNVQETACIIKALWDNFQTPPSKHNSLHKIFEQPIGSVQLVRPSLLRRVSKELSGIGWGRSKEVSEHFKSVKEMVNADSKQWQEIEGIGKGIAKKVVQEINNEHQ
jgi:ERCC4-type nuclease